jgi:hypothetical protein
MRLDDCFPRWIHPDVFAFLCPHCGEAFLTCKRVPMSVWDQMAAAREHFGEQGDFDIVPCRKDMAWVFQNAESFETLTVTPSLDASASGHWHGFIQNGGVVGGIVRS